MLLVVKKVCLVCLERIQLRALGPNQSGVVAAPGFTAYFIRHVA